MDKIVFQHNMPVIIGDFAFEEAVEDICNRNYQRGLLLVADTNTYPACGETLECMLRERNEPVKKIILEGSPRVAANETSIARILQALNGEEYCLIAVGSGTITDLVRFIAYQARLPFLSVPTALSVDSYTSYTAAISIDHVKYSFAAKTAGGVYGHLPTLCAAPHNLTAAGFSDMIAKFTAFADWKLANLLVNDVFDAAVAGRARQAAEDTARHAGGVRISDPASLTKLMNGLCISGHCMAAMKSSRPAAGSEHSLAHYWEMTHAMKGLPESLHGQKTGVATIIIAGLYEKLRSITRSEAARRLSRIDAIDAEKEITGIRRAYGKISDQILANRVSFLGSLGDQVETIKTRIIDNWDQIIEIAREVPGPDEIRSLLTQAGAVSEPGEIHISTKDIQMAIRFGMYTRPRFTILELNRLLCLE